jgi:hypothetical protein
MGRGCVGQGWRLLPEDRLSSPRLAVVALVALIVIVPNHAERVAAA